MFLAAIALCYTTRKTSENLFTLPESGAVPRTATQAICCTDYNQMNMVFVTKFGDKAFISMVPMLQVKRISLAPTLILQVYHKKENIRNTNLQLHRYTCRYVGSIATHRYRSTAKKSCEIESLLMNLFILIARVVKQRYWSRLWYCLLFCGYSTKLAQYLLQSTRGFA